MPLPPYEMTQPYQLGKLYKEFGERLMDQRTDMRDLHIIACHMGLKITISLEAPDCAAAEAEQAVQK